MTPPVTSPITPPVYCHPQVWLRAAPDEVLEKSPPLRTTPWVPAAVVAQARAEEERAARARALAEGPLIPKPPKVPRPPTVSARLDSLARPLTSGAPALVTPGPLDACLRLGGPLVSPIFRELYSQRAWMMSGGAAANQLGGSMGGGGMGGGAASARPVGIAELTNHGELIVNSARRYRAQVGRERLDPRLDHSFGSLLREHQQFWDGTSRYGAGRLLPPRPGRLQPLGGVRRAGFGYM